MNNKGEFSKRAVSSLDIDVSRASVSNKRRDHQNVYSVKNKFTSERDKLMNIVSPVSAANQSANFHYENNPYIN